MTRLFRRFSRLCIAAIFLASLTSYASDLRVGIVFDKGGKDDKSFNNAAYRGAMKAKGDLKVFVKYVEATDDTAYEGSLREFARMGFDLIFAIGVSQAEAMKKVAAEFPDKHFAIVDADVRAPNVRSLLFQEHEGSYLMGAAAAMASKTGKIGFIGGMDIPLIRRFELAYVAGAKKINPKIRIDRNYIGVTSEAWNNPARAHELALAQYSDGADVVFAAAGASNSGVFDASEEDSKAGATKLVIGVDSNQDWVKPGLVLTSMLKRVDEAVYRTIQDASQGKFAGGTARFGLKDGGIDYATDEYNAKILTPGMRKRLDALKARIIAGRIKVPDYYQKH